MFVLCSNRNLRLTQARNQEEQCVNRVNRKIPKRDVDCEGMVNAGTSGHRLPESKSRETLTMFGASYPAIQGVMVRKKGSDSDRGPTPSRKREDGRKQLLVYLPPELIKDLKKAGLDDERNAYEIVEEALRAWLGHRGQRADSA